MPQRPRPKHAPDALRRVIEFLQASFSREPRLIELAPSILSADFARLAEQVRSATEGGGTVIHVDIMDGHFAT